MTIRLREMRRSAFCLLMGGNEELGGSSSDELQLAENARSEDFGRDFEKESWNRRLWFIGPYVTWN